MNNPILSLLGIARKAGKLSLGTESAKSALQKNKSNLILLAADISNKTEKELRFLSNGKTPLIRLPFNTFQISNAVGTKTGIISVDDSGFAKAIDKKIPKSETEEN